MLARDLEARNVEGEKEIWPVCMNFRGRGGSKDLKVGLRKKEDSDPLPTLKE